jgi:hypothetical protein
VRLFSCPGEAGLTSIESIVEKLFKRSNTEKKKESKLIMQ